MSEISIIESVLRDNIKLRDEFDRVNKELEKANEEIQKLKEHLKKYTAPARRKKYYEAHKEELLQKAKKYDYTNTETKEQRSEYNKRYYAKKKEKELSKNRDDCE
jgi:hypothetical protein